MLKDICYLVNLSSLCF